MKSDVIGRVSINIYATVPKVWEALTNPEMIRKYFFGTNAITDWKAGSTIVFEGEWEGHSYKDKGTVLKVEPYKLLSYNYWSSMSGIEDIPENYVTITYELLDEGNKTSLTIIQENIPTEEMREHSEQNWKKILHNLKELVEK
ncbi:MAG TPA: SRPBCC family protein [Bacteroidia bacterium]